MRMDPASVSLNPEASTLALSAPLVQNGAGPGAQGAQPQPERKAALAFPATYGEGP